VYSLPAEARLVDLIELAGGMTAQADLAQVNLAQDLRDSEKVIIPVLPQLDLDTGRKEVALIAANPDQTSTNQPLININQASQAELEKLSGIGPSKAAAILKYRKQQGKFSDKNDLLNISGIGEKTLANIIDEICL
jgi:competence protein ComEA